MADIGEVEHHRQAQKLVAPIVHNGTTACDDGFGEMIVQRHACVADGHRGLAIHDKRGQCRDMQQPPLRGYVVVAVACPDANVCHL